ncbi:MAG: GTPase ObgE [Candidatus Gracilibacteria bacterium]|nr:GTPase ObgE [Candidatus Gracilibacteria bacterium]MDD2908636.1 GTPase ObgE [Candidatus Gracilibacteria bacterium]
MFIDEVKVTLIAGKGGDGSVSWRREKYIPKGGPFGGNGGTGGNIIFRTNPNENTLGEFRHKKVIKTKAGENGGIRDLAGAGSLDVILNVPVGTLVKDEEGKLIRDLSTPWESYVICKGGRGGYGNAHFVSSTRQAPSFAEIGDVGEEKTVNLELKLVADIGIIGLPNAGKSTLIKSITNVKPKIADYPFTTIIPNLGVLEYKGKSLVLEDVPGLIEGASEGKGLGHSFLKHIERTKVILHLLDLNGLDDLVKNYETIRNELKKYSKELAEKEELIVLSKADLFDNEMIEFITKEFKSKIKSKNPIFVISAPSLKGIEELKDFLIENYVSKNSELLEESEVENQVKVYDLKNEKDINAYRVIDLGSMNFEIKGDRIEQIARMTNMQNYEGIMRVYDIMKKLSIIKKIAHILDTKYKEEMNLRYFEGDDESIDVIPKVYIAGRCFPLDKVLFDSNNR